MLEAYALAEFIYDDGIENRDRKVNLASKFWKKSWK